MICMAAKTAAEVLMELNPNLKKNWGLLDAMLHFPDKYRWEQFGGITTRELLRQHGITAIPEETNNFVVRQEVPRGFW